MKKNPFTLSVLLTSALLSGPVAAQSDAEFQALIQNSTDEDKRNFCSGVRGVADELNTQLPMRLDPATRLINASAFFLGGTCSYKLSYEIHEGKLFEMLQPSLSELVGEDVPMEFVQQYYGVGGPGYSEIQKSLKNNLMADPNITRLANVPFVDMTAEYIILGSHMSNFQLQLGKTNQ